MEKRAAIYLRVSSEEQTYENQRPEVNRLARTRGYRIVTRYEEQVRTSRARPEYTRMMHDAHQGQFDMLVVWALDRFGRSTVGNIQAVLDLDRCGVQVVKRARGVARYERPGPLPAHRDLRVGSPSRSAFA